MYRNYTIHKEEKVRKKIAILFVASLMLVATGIPAFADVPENTGTQDAVTKAQMMDMTRNGNPICQCSCDGNNISEGITQTDKVMLLPRNIHYPCWCDCGYEPPPDAQF